MLKQAVLCSLFLPILFLASDTSAQVYRLANASDYLEGCLAGLCLCPVRLYEELEGTLRLIPDGDNEFEVRDVRWTVLYDSEALHFTGEGRYARRGDGTPNEQRMEVTLTADGGEAILFDTGWIPLGSNDDHIDLHLPMAEIVCSGSAFDLSAVPESSVSDGGVSWSAIKSRW